MTQVRDECRAEPLKAHRLFQSWDLDEAREFVARAFCRHRLETTAPGARLHTLHNHARGATLSLNYLRYGAGVRIEPGFLDSFYLVQIPVRGAARVRNGGVEVEASRTTASLLNPTRWTGMVWSEDCEKLLVQIDRAALHRLAETLTGHDLPRPVVFEPRMALDAAPIRRWTALLAACFAAAEDERAFGRAVAPNQTLIEEELIAALLTVQPSNMSHLVDGRPRGLAPRQVKRAQDYIHARLGDPITVAEVARAVQCSTRSLQFGFRSHFGCSPLDYIRRQRLGMAHFTLQSDGPATVGDVAEAVGYSHHGRFAREYRAAFGKPPSETLKARAAARRRDAHRAAFPA